MDRSSWFEPKWRLLRRFAVAATLGALLAVPGAALEQPALIIPGVLLFFPLLFLLVFIPVLHWKDRYIGQRSGVWGAFLVFETSSWSKVFYWFRHVLPDWRRSGRYSDAL